MKVIIEILAVKTREILNHNCEVKKSLKKSLKKNHDSHDHDIKSRNDDQKVTHRQKHRLHVHRTLLLALSGDDQLFR